MVGNRKDLSDNNEALVKSLESIKALLAKSETKLSAARESLTQANKGPSMKKPELEIPTLDEVVEANQQFQIDLPDERDIPVLDSIEAEGPIFKLDDEDDYDFAESTLTIDTSSQPLDQDAHEEAEDIPLLSVESLEEEKPIPELMAVHLNEEPAATAIELPDLSPLLNAIDDVEGSMRSQISAAAIAFEERLNSELDLQMQKLRDQVYALVDKQEEQ